MLKRQGVIRRWYDREIGAGEEIDPRVREELEKADIILLLVSPYFLASDYCYEIEMQRALERHREGTARVIPIILHPCDWQHAPFMGLKAVPPDGKPVSSFANRHDAFVQITRAIREAAPAMERPGQPDRAAAPARATTSPTSAGGELAPPSESGNSSRTGIATPSSKGRSRTSRRTSRPRYTPCRTRPPM